ncbi:MULTISPECIES: restriction endonuclease subunit S [Citrobacter freundii complex]|uniref:restriction endonuclease subunit S n=1 Tax=Citrobacter freundii complex TaxID=1344959 RepID=UPI0015E993E6|nr:restriction endonuclease subunit S [Citrobacter freundii]QLX36684.1 restriction endonuclease subunit S [Citrobacter freundii]
MSFEFIETELGNFVEIVTKKCDASIIDVTNYISTENMLPDRQGVTISSGIPDVNKFNSFEIGDTLFSNIRTYFKKVWFATFYGGVSPDVLVFRTTHEKLTSEYLHLILSSDDFINYSHLTSKGAKMPRGDKGAMLSYKIKIPSLKYQKRCIKLIFTLSKKIDSNNRINQTLEQMAQALFKSWFVDFDPVKAKMAVLDAGGSQADATLAAMTAISGKDADALAVFEREHPEQYAELKATAELFPSAMQESEGRDIPKGWAVVKTEELTSKIGMGPFGSNIKVSTFVDEGIPIISGQHLKESILNDGENNFVTLEHADKLKSSNVFSEDIIFTHAGSIGQVSIIPEFSEYDRYVISQRQFFLRADKKLISPYYLLYFFRSRTGQHLLLSNASQVGVPSIARPSSHLKNIELVAPDFKLVKKFEDHCKTIINGVVQRKKQTVLLKNIRDTLLPKLLSGEITLPEAEQAVSEAENV